MYGVGETVEERSQASKPHSVKSMTVSIPCLQTDGAISDSGICNHAPP